MKAQIFACVNENTDNVVNISETACDTPGIAYYCCDPPAQSSSSHSRAQPRFTQCSIGLSVFSNMAMTKLVECPVVDRVPFRTDVL